MSAEASVALYSLGRADLLEAITSSIVERLVTGDYSASSDGCSTSAAAPAAFAQPWRRW
jgi:hypothetical protein